MGIYFISSFLRYYGMKYIRLVVDYDFKWVKAVALPNNKGRSVTAFLKKNIFSCLALHVLFLVMVGHTYVIVYLSHLSQNIV